MAGYRYCHNSDLLVGATSVFSQLRIALNTIWEVKPKARKAVVLFFIDKLFSMGMIACLAMLLLVSLVIHTGLDAFTYYLGLQMKMLSTTAIAILDILLSFGLTALLFAVIYKFMSDARLKWRNVWFSALFTSVLFVIGKYLIGLYISKSGVASGYGAASSVVADTFMGILLFANKSSSGPNWDKCHSHGEWCFARSQS